MRGAAQILADCPHCRVESAMVELIDPTERVGVALEGRCRLCGYGTELGEVVRPGQPFVDADDVVEALARWAAEDGEEDVHLFAVANFNGRDPAAIARAVLAGERVDTGFDVIAWLFPSFHGGPRRGDEDERPAPRLGLALGKGSGAGFGGSGGPRPPGGGVAGAGPDGAPPRTAAGVPGGSSPRGPSAGPVRTPHPDLPPHNVARPADPHDIGRALASVMLADGVIRAVERRFVDEALARMGAPPLRDVDLRVWRPMELGPVPDPQGLVDVMRALALCDGEADGSERRVIEEFARAWGVRLPADVLPRPGALAALGRALRDILLR